MDQPGDPAQSRGGVEQSTYILARRHVDSLDGHIVARVGEDFRRGIHALLPFVRDCTCLPKPTRRAMAWPICPGPMTTTISLLAVLLITDLLHPLDHLALERLRNCDVGHRGGRRGTVPVFLAG